MPKSTAILSPNLGLYYDRTPLSVPPGGLQDGNNFRIQQGKLTNANLGWSSFAAFTLNGAVTLITSLHLRSGLDILIFGTPTDLYQYSTSGGGTVTYITPIYNTGTASASGTAVTGSGTSWNSGSPVNVKAGDEICFTGSAVVTPGSTWYKVLSVNSDTSLTLTSSAGTIADHAYTIRKKYLGDAADYWQAESFVNAAGVEDRIYFTNSVDPPQRWNGSDAQVTSLTALGFTCSTIVEYKNMMLYGNLVQSGTSKPTDFINSNVGDPENVTTGLASQFKVSGRTDSITLLKKMGDYLVIYLQKMIIVANFVGDPLVFVFRVAVDGKGLQAIRGVAVFPDYHEFLGADTMYAFNGAVARQISNHVWREVHRISDPARAKNIFATIDETRGSYIWSVPLTTDPGAGTHTSPNVSAWAEHYLEQVPQNAEIPYSKRDFPFISTGTYARQATLTWDQLTNAWNTYNFRWNDQFFAAAFPLTLGGDVNGKVWIINGSQDANTAGLASFVKFGRRAVVDGRNKGLVARVYPFITAFSNALTVTVNLADFASGAATIQASVAYDQTLPEGLYFAPIYRTGRYMDMQFGTAGPGMPYEIQGYDVEVRPGGMR